MSYTQDNTFKGLDFTRSLPHSEFDNCTFIACNFEQSDLSNIKFNDCTFEECNLSLAKLTQTAFRNVHFKDCKMLGLRFDACNPFGIDFSFDRCQLKHSSYFELKIKKTKFASCQLEEVDFANSDLSESVFDNCDLRGSVFDQTTLIKSDFRSAVNYSINPEQNKIKKAKFSLAGVSGLLNKYDIVIEQ